MITGRLAAALSAMPPLAMRPLAILPLAVLSLAVLSLGGQSVACAAENSGTVVSGEAIEQALRDGAAPSVAPTAPDRPIDRGLHIATDRGIHIVPAVSSGGGSSEQKAVHESRPSIDLNIPFEFNSSQLQPQATAQLTQLQMALNSASLQQNRFMIAGHTDAVGSAAYNHGLSERRAAAVKQFLVSKGIAAARLETAGYGSERLLLPDRPEDPGNRRVEIRNLGN